MADSAFDMQVIKISVVILLSGKHYAVLDNVSLWEIKFQIFLRAATVFMTRRT